MRLSEQNVERFEYAMGISMRPRGVQLARLTFGVDGS